METSENEIQRLAKVIRCYELGIFTLLETGHKALASMTPENVPQILAMLPFDVREYVVAVANDAPHTDAEWTAAKYVSIGAGSSSPGYVPLTEAECEAAMETWKIKHRLCVEAIRHATA